MVLGGDKMVFGIGGGGGAGDIGGALGLFASFCCSTPSDVLLLKRFNRIFISSSRAFRTFALICDSDMVVVFDSNAATVC